MLKLGAAAGVPTSTSHPLKFEFVATKTKMAPSLHNTYHMRQQRESDEDKWNVYLVVKQPDNVLIFEFLETVRRVGMKGCSDTYGPRMCGNIETQYLKDFDLFTEQRLRFGQIFLADALHSNLPVTFLQQDRRT